MRRMRLAMTGLAAAAAAVAVYLFVAPDGADGPGGPGGDEVVIPALSDSGARGQVAYGRVCASCHGDRIDGTDKGPPLIHGIYNPGHHNDESFFRAARRGVPRHHWNFGDMPPQPKVSRRDIAEIIRYIRELQEANGIVWKKHSM